VCVCVPYNYVRYNALSCFFVGDCLRDTRVHSRRCLLAVEFHYSGELSIAHVHSVITIPVSACFVNIHLRGQDSSLSLLPCALKWACLRGYPSSNPQMKPSLW